jgi:hypothetical protein
MFNAQCRSAHYSGCIKGCGSAKGTLQCHPLCSHSLPSCHSFLFSLMSSPSMSPPPVGLWRENSRRHRFSTQVSEPLHPHSIRCENNCTTPGSPEYTEAMDHFSTVNVQQSACVVQPATQGHVGTIVRVFSPSFIIHNKRLRPPFCSSRYYQRQKRHSP